MALLEIGRLAFSGSTVSFCTLASRVHRDLDWWTGYHLGPGMQLPTRQPFQQRTENGTLPWPKVPEFPSPRMALRSLSQACYARDVENCWRFDGICGDGL